MNEVQKKLLVQFHNSKEGHYRLVAKLEDSADASKIAINLVCQRFEHEIFAIKILARSTKHLIQCHVCDSCVSTGWKKPKKKPGQQR